MSCDTLSQLFSDVYLGLAQPDDSFLSKLELSNIMFRRLGLRLEQVRQSEQAIMIAKSSTFTLASTTDEKNLTTTIADFVVPMWAEQQTSNFNGNPIWRFIPTVHLAMLAQKRALGIPAVSFHGSNATEVLATFSFYGNETWNPYNNIRVWYLPTISFPSTEQTAIQLPQNLISMVVYDTYVSAIPIMIANAARSMQDSPTIKDQVVAWQGLYSHYMRERSEFEILWKKWVSESRGSHRPRRRGDILPNRVGNSAVIWSVNNN